MKITSAPYLNKYDFWADPEKDEEFLLSNR